MYSMIGEQVETELEHRMTQNEIELNENQLNDRRSYRPGRRKSLIAHRPGRSEDLPVIL